MQTRNFGIATPHQILARFTSMLSITHVDPETEKAVIGTTDEVCDAIDLMVVKFRGDRSTLVKELRGALTNALNVVNSRFAEVPCDSTT